MKKLISFILLLTLVVAFSGCTKEESKDGQPPEVGMSPEECLNQGGRTVNTVGGETCGENEENIGNVVGFISPNICCVPLESEMTLEEAKRIAENSECTEKGTLTESYIHNKITNTWWIDLDMKDEFEKEGCNPACVVDKVAKTAEINWRCTGVITE